MPNDILEHLQTVADAKEIAKDFLEAHAALADTVSNNADIVSNIVENVTTTQSTFADVAANSTVINDFAENVVANQNTLLDVVSSHQDSGSHIVGAVADQSDFVPYTVSITGYNSAADAATGGISPEDYNKYHSTGHGLVGVGAGAAMVGASGVGAGQGIAAGRAAEAVGRNPEAEGKIRTIFIVGVAIAESAALYSLIVAVLLLFVF